MVLRIIIDVFLVIGAFFALIGTLGILKMPDTICRMQAATCIPTLGVICVAVGAILYAAFIMHSTQNAVKIAVIATMIVVTNPVGSHAIARGSYRADLRMDKNYKVEPDDYGRDFYE